MPEKKPSNAELKEAVFLIVIGVVYIGAVLGQITWLMWLMAGAFVLGLVWVVVTTAPNDGRGEGGASGVGIGLGGDGGCGGGGDGGGGGC